MKIRSPTGRRILNPAFRLGYQAAKGGKAFVMPNYVAQADNDAWVEGFRLGSMPATRPRRIVRKR
jgi:hypothetical protein